VKLIQTNEIQIKQTKSKKAIDHFKRCPLCGDADLINVSPEVVCSNCDWNSCLWSVSRGRMDNLHSAVIEELRESGKVPTLIKPVPVHDDEDIHLDIAAGEFR
jgi:hypothetical protein